MLVAYIGGDRWFRDRPTVLPDSTSSLLVVTTENEMMLTGAVGAGDIGNCQLFC